ncbi:hypothetical protein Vadar_011890 [Vaccinium darrowii]|uniref:Uncharacterized protein n=1 Tax=Vaccinium darrowii TaxID=229202 RepID=A0ACB7ZAK3_9ERIC|nr:hypothetical protein Vadar_011890 [Vaccinium darrowii]
MSSTTTPPQSTSAPPQQFQPPQQLQYPVMSSQPSYGGNNYGGNRTNRIPPHFVIPRTYSLPSSTSASLAHNIPLSSISLAGPSYTIASPPPPTIVSHSSPIDSSLSRLGDVERTSRRDDGDVTGGESIGSIPTIGEKGSGCNANKFG